MQYWPDGSSPVLALGGGASIEHLTSSYTGSYYVRHFQLCLPGGGTRKVALDCIPRYRDYSTAKIGFGGSYRILNIFLIFFLLKC